MAVQKVSNPAAYGPGAVTLTDLRVIQQFSLAVRTATAPHDDLIEALESDLAWLKLGAPARVSPAARRRPSVPRRARSDDARPSTTGDGV